MTGIPHNKGASIPEDFSSSENSKNKEHLTKAVVPKEGIVSRRKREIEEQLEKAKQKLETTVEKVKQKTDVTIEKHTGKPISKERESEVDLKMDKVAETISPNPTDWFSATIEFFEKRWIPFEKAIINAGYQQISKNNQEEAEDLFAHLQEEESGELISREPPSINKPILEKDLEPTPAEIPVEKKKTDDVMAHLKDIPSSVKDNYLIEQPDHVKEKTKPMVYGEIKDPTIKADFIDFTKNLETLGVPKGQQVVQKEKELVFEMKKTSPLIEFFKKFFKTGQSQKTQKALGTIFMKIQIQLRAGYTHFTLLPKKQSKNSPTSLPGVEEGPKTVELGQLAEDFLKTDYAQNVIKQSPRIASSVATIFLNIIDRKYGYFYREYEYDAKRWVSSDQFKNLNSVFMNLMNKTPYDGEAVLNFINSLPEKSKALEKMTPLEKEIKESDDRKEVPTFETQAISIGENEKLGPLLDELLDTEITFKLDMAILKEHYKKLLNENIIDSADYDELTSDLEKIIKESQTLLNNLAPLINNQATAKDKLIAHQKAFSPENIKNYYEAYKAFVPKTQSLAKKMIEIEKTTRGAQATKAFKGENKTISPSDYISFPMQRILRHQLLMADIIKNTSTDNDEFKSEMKNNILYLQNYTKLINLSNIP